MSPIILLTDIIEKLVLVFLVGLSIWSISIMIDRKRILKNLISDDTFKQIKEMISVKDFSFQKLQNQGFFAEAFIHAQKHSNQFKNVESIDRSISSYIKEQRGQLEKGLSWLATLGANAPFIGLFGTVLGIMRAFANLGSQSGGTSVMSGVAQALCATAMGLLVAIPAVVAYNHFSNQIKRAIQQTESLRDLLISQIENK